MNRARLVAVGSTWLLASQIAAFAIQIPYSAITARIALPTQFGEYAIALAGAALVLLVATSGLPQTAARAPSLDEPTIRGLVLTSLTAGLVAGAALLVLATPWARMWGEPAAAAPMRVMALAACLTPLAALLGGVARRDGHFRGLATSLLVSNAIGLLVGLLAVAHLRSSAALATAQVVATYLTVAALRVVVDRPLLPRLNTRLHPDHARFAGQVLASNVASFFIGNVNRWAVSRFLGPATMGSWNRADVLTTVPLQQLHTAMVGSLYPEFRHDVDNSTRIRSLWPDLLVMTAWITLPLSAFSAAILPSVIPILYGPGWEQAARLAPPLAIIAGLQAPTILLAAALEATARFRWIWLTHGCLMFIQLCAMVATVAMRSMAPVLVGLLIVALTRHSLQLWLAARASLMDQRPLVRGYSEVAGTSIAVGLGAYALVWFNADSAVDTGLSAALSLSMLATLGVVLFRLRERLPPVRLARKYGLLPGITSGPTPAA